MSNLRSSWFYAFVLVSLFLCCVTFFMPLLPSPFSYFNLRNENNFAALFSGIFLLVVALHAYDGWSLNRALKPNVACAWLAVFFVLTALSFDEIGSLHERVTWLRSIISDGTVAPPSELQSLPQAEKRSIYWWSLLPFGMLLVGATAYAVTALWRSIEDRRTVILIGVGFALLASVALQEYIERTVDWSANEYLHIVGNTFRPLIEEGTELLAMIILLKVAMNNTRGVLSPGERSSFPVFDAVVSLRRLILVIGIVAAPLIAYVTASFPTERHENGMPADWPAAALFSLAAIAAARPFFVSGRGIGWFGWSLVLLSLVGCGSTILSPESTAAVPLAGALAGAAILVWFLSANYMPKTYLPAGVILSIVFASTWYVGNNDFVVYTVIQYTALAFYWVNSSVVSKTAQPTTFVSKLIPSSARSQRVMRKVQ